MPIYSELSLILFVALGVSVLMRALKQPLIIGYILTGIVVGPYLLNIVHSFEAIELFSRLGITALLFIVGLGLSPKIIKELGLISLVTGVGQVVFTSFFGFFIAYALKFNVLESVYIAVALTFSSTIIILKLLTDKGDVNKLYGRVAIGFLLVQDLIATIIMIVISSLSSSAGKSNGNVALDLGLVLLEGLVVLIVLFLVSNYVLPKFADFIGKSGEFLFVGALAWGIGIPALYAFLGLSIEIGALIAGITLSITPFSLEISSRFKPLRDFFIIMFFISLGFQMSFDNFSQLFTPMVVFSIFILVGNPLIVLILMNLLGYTKRNGFLAGLTVAQISEFSLILVALGYEVGHISHNALSVVTLVGIVTISASTYLIMYSESIYKKLEKYLHVFQFRKGKKEKVESLLTYDALIFGYKRAGPLFASTFLKNNFKFVAVDYNPEVVASAKINGIEALYGDIEDIEFLQELPLKEVKLIVSTVSDIEANRLLLSHLKNTNNDAISIAFTDTKDNAKLLYDLGATFVVLEHYVGAYYASSLIEKHKFDKDSYSLIRESQRDLLS